MLPIGVSAAAVLVVLAVDRRLGEPPLRLHTVVAMGHYLTCAGRCVHGVTGSAQIQNPYFKAFWLGALAWCAGAAIIFVVFLALQQTLMALAGERGCVWGGLLVAVVIGFLLKPLLAWAMLQSEVLAAGGLYLRKLRVEARRAPSPNSGWPMAAMALALNVCLHKPHVCALNVPGRAPLAQDLHAAIVVASKVLLTLIWCAQEAIIYVALRGSVA